MEALTGIFKADKSYQQAKRTFDNYLARLKSATDEQKHQEILIDMEGFPRAAPQSAQRAAQHILERPCRSVWNF